MRKSCESTPAFNIVCNGTPVSQPTISRFYKEFSLTRPDSVLKKEASTRAERKELEEAAKKEVEEMSMPSSAEDIQKAQKRVADAKKNVEQIDKRLDIASRYL